VTPNIYIYDIYIYILNIYIIEFLLIGLYQYPKKLATNAESNAANAESIGNQCGFQITWQGKPMWSLTNFLGVAQKKYFLTKLN
jgi:hypothetical protein